MNEFTPGPWRVIRGTSVVTPSIAPVGKGPQVAMTMHPSEYNCKANALLIASAPNLFRALNICIKAINPSDKGGISMSKWNERLKNATETARASIAEAEGKTWIKTEAKP